MQPLQVTRTRDPLASWTQDKHTPEVVVDSWRWIASMTDTLSASVLADAVATGAGANNRSEGGTCCSEDT